jgi:hypothetical protein
MRKRGGALEQFPLKWIPVERKKVRQNKNLERRSGSIRSKNALSAGFSLLLLAGCAGPGDFGRPKSSVVNQTLLPLAGAILARGREETVSTFPFTDDEEELRARAWRFLMPSHERSWFDGIVAELGMTRILPVHEVEIPQTSYFQALIDGSFRSPASLYRRIGEDIQADEALIGPFARHAAKVLSADQMRLRSLLYVKDLSFEDTQNATARIAQNRCLISWVRSRVPQRLAAYRYALEHVAIMAPQKEAIETERILGKFTAYEKALGSFGVPPLEKGVCAPPLAPPFTMNTSARQNSTPLKAKPIIAKN